jgi:hypothetical protein
VAYFADGLLPSRDAKASGPTQNSRNAQGTFFVWRMDIPPCEVKERAQAIEKDAAR